MAKKQTILFLHAGAEMYGADKVLLDLVTGLDKDCFNIIVVLPCDGELYKKMIDSTIEVYIVNYPILRRKYFNVRGAYNYVKNYLHFSKELVGLIRQWQVDIIHINTTAVLEGIYIKTKLGLPLVWHIHEILQKPYFLYQLMCVCIQTYADQIVVVSQAVKNHLMASKKVTDEKIQVIYNGSSSHEFYSEKESDYLRAEFKLPASACVVGMIGRVNAWKGQTDFVAALEKVMEDHENVYGVLVGGTFAGEEWRFTKLQETIDLSRYADRFRLVNQRRDIANFHALFDIFVLPSTNPDPLPTVVLEAMSTGRPVVGYGHGGLCEMVVNGYNGLLSEVKNPVSLGADIKRLVDNPEERALFGQRSANRQATCFSLETYVASFSDCYLELANKGKQG